MTRPAEEVARECVSRLYETTPTEAGIAYPNVVAAITHVVVSERRAAMAWRRGSEADCNVVDLATLLRPSLGGHCTQIGMSPNGKRYAFIFDNPAKGYWFMPLPEPPEATT